MDGCHHLMKYNTVQSCSNVKVLCVKGPKPSEMKVQLFSQFCDVRITIICKDIVTEILMHRQHRVINLSVSSAGSLVFA